MGSMERAPRYITCPKCRKSIRVRDISHFRSHGIKIVRWKSCEREVGSDRSTDLRDHVRRRHPNINPETIVPIWGNVGSSPQTGLSRAAKVESGHTVRATGKPTTPAASQGQPPVEGSGAERRESQVRDPSPVIDILVGNTDELSFLTSASSTVSPTKIPKSVVQRSARLSPLHGLYLFTYQC